MGNLWLDCLQNRCEVRHCSNSLNRILIQAEPLSSVTVGRSFKHSVRSHSEFLFSIKQNVQHHRTRQAEVSGEGWGDHSLFSSSLRRTSASTPYGVATGPDRQDMKSLVHCHFSDKLDESSTHEDRTFAQFR